MGCQKRGGVSPTAESQLRMSHKLFRICKPQPTLDCPGPLPLCWLTHAFCLILFCSMRVLPLEYCLCWRMERERKVKLQLRPLAEFFVVLNNMVEI